MANSKVLVFAASNNTASINKRLALHAAAVLRDDLAVKVEIEVLDLNDFEMPIFSPDREKEGIPQQAQDFFAKLGAADGLIVSFAEYNGSYTAAFKNIFDWSSRIEMKIYQNKPLLALATSIGKGGARNVLNTAVVAAPFFGGRVTSQFNFGPFADHFDTDTNQLTTPELAQDLREALMAFQAAL